MPGGNRPLPYLGKANKLYSFKLYLSAKNVERLKKISFPYISLKENIIYLLPSNICRNISNIFFLDLGIFLNIANLLDRNESAKRFLLANVIGLTSGGISTWQLPHEELTVLLRSKELSEDDENPSSDDDELSSSVSLSDSCLQHMLLISSCTSVVTIGSISASLVSSSTIF